MIGAAIRQPFTIVLGLVLGVLAGFATIPIYQFGMDSYDSEFHVLTMTAKVIAANADKVTIHATGEKRRECQYLRLYAYTVHDAGILHDANIQRVDLPEDRDSKPLGSFDFGFWAIWPREDAVGIQVFSEHLCSGRKVVNKIIDIKVPK
jgi:hypothetical protein